MTSNMESIELQRAFQSLLTHHAELRAKETARLQRLLHAFQVERRKWVEAQRKTADDFNLFKVMGVESDEVRHSKILAWLLDHRVDHGTHAQGNLGFALFLEELGKELQEQDKRRVTAYANESNYWVNCEVSGDEARVDIEIAAHGKFLIHIENKIWSAEGGDQTNREWRDMLARATELDVPDSACHAIFLTLEGTEAENQYFRPVRWMQVAKVLDKFAERTEPRNVQLFARHYAHALRKLSGLEREREETEAEDADI